MAEHIEGKWCSDLHCNKCYSADTWQKSELARLRAELAEKSKNDERYRWLRNSAQNDYTATRLAFRHLARAIDGLNDPSRLEELDAAIDAALGKEGV